jgi:hypothetical protein
VLLMDSPTIIVAGLGRCGTTMVMNMLAAGGIHCAGTAPDYEIEETNQRPVSQRVLLQNAGRALKVLDPQRAVINRNAPTVVIWLDRDFKNQALSQAKMVSTFMGRPMPSRTELRKWTDSLRRDRALALHHLPPSPLLKMTFESIIADRQAAAERIVEFLASSHPGMNTKAMAGVVITREPHCMPDMSIEVLLVQAAEAGII